MQGVAGTFGVDTVSAEMRIDRLQDRVAELEAVVRECLTSFKALASESSGRNDNRFIGYVMMADKCDATLSKSKGAE